MDWSRFQRALELNAFENILDALTNLHKRLCNANDAAIQYPQAGYILTAASKHPSIAANPRVAEQLLACLMAYAKLQHVSKQQPLETQPRSILWCIHRLRRLTQSGRSERNAYERFLSALDQRNGRVSSRRLRQVLDRSLLLVHDSTGRVIEKLVDYALDHTTQPDDPLHWRRTQHFSPRFLRYLMSHRSLYRSWSCQTRARLCLQFNELLDTEFYDALESLTSGLTKPAELQDRLLDTSLVQLLMHEPRLFTPLYHTMADTVLVLADWRVFSVCTCLLVDNSITEHWPSGLIPAATLLMNPEKPVQEICAELQGIFSSHVYNGLYNEVMIRRAEAWLLSYFYPRFLWSCISTVVQHWCINMQQDDVDTKTDEICKYLGWLVCPSLDDRQIAATDALYSWFSLLKRLRLIDDNNRSAMIEWYTNNWPEAVNGNLIVGILVTICLALFIPGWEDDDRRNLFDAVLLLKKPSRYNSALVFIAADYLCKISPYISNNSTIDILKQHVNSIM